MKKIIISIVSLALASMASAQLKDLTTNTDKFQIVGAGLRVGGGSYMQTGDGLTASLGLNGAVDGVYGFYFARSDKSKPYIGIRSGLSIAYGQNKVTASEVSQTYKATFVDGEKGNLDVTYRTIATDVEETNSRIALEVPVMASAIYKCFWANLGVRVGIPIISNYKQDLASASVTAQVTDGQNFDMPIENSLALGRVDGKSFDDKLEGPSFNVSLAFEGGYAMEVAGNWLMLGAYFNYGLVNNFDGGKVNHIDCDLNSLPANVTVNSLTKSCADKMGEMSFGIKASYNWQLGNSSGSKISKSSKSSKSKSSGKKKGGKVRF